MNLIEIIGLEGIVIRRIPKETVFHWSTSEKELQRRKKEGAKTITNDKGRELIVEHKTFSLGGKYLVTFQFDQDKTVMFHAWGVGDTIEEAHQDFVNKKELKA